MAKEFPTGIIVTIIAIFSAFLILVLVADVMDLKPELTESLYYYEYNPYTWNQNR
jgi:hypothetical protein